MGEWKGQRIGEHWPSLVKACFYWDQYQIPKGFKELKMRREEGRDKLGLYGEVVGMFNCCVYQKNK